MTNPVQLIVAIFSDEDGADRALKELRQAKRERLIGIENAAVIRKGLDGEVRFKETADMGGGQGAVIGAVVGAVVGIMTGGVGLLLGAAGALVGGLAAKLHDTGFDDARLRVAGESLQPGSSAIVAVIEHKWVGELAETLTGAGADVLTEDIPADIAALLGGDWAPGGATLPGFEDATVVGERRAPDEPAHDGDAEEKA